MVLNPLTAEFWQNENSLLWEAVDEIMLASLLAGAGTGIDLLPEAARQLVHIETFNSQAIAYLNTYRLTTVPGINETTRNQAVRIINEWMFSGDPLSVLERALAPIFGEYRASMIAITEITRAYAMGNQLLWMSAGVVGGKRWMTARDERVCAACGPMHNTIVELNANFMNDVDKIANSPQMKAILGSNYTPEAGLKRANNLVGHIGSSVLTPPLHVNCRCWLQPIVSEQLFEEQLERILA